MSRDPAGAPAPPTLRLVRGEAAPEEIAALLAVLSARSASGSNGSGGSGGTAGTAGTTDRPRRGGWGDHAQALGAASHLLLRPGPGSWRASGRPR